MKKRIHSVLAADLSTGGGDFILFLLVSVQLI